MPIAGRGRPPEGGDASGCWAQASPKSQSFVNAGNLVDQPEAAASPEAAMTAPARC